MHAKCPAVGQQWSVSDALQVECLTLFSNVILNVIYLLKVRIIEKQMYQKEHDDFTKHFFVKAICSYPAFEVGI